MPALVPPFHDFRSAADLERAAAVPSGTIDRIARLSPSDLYLRHELPKKNRAKGMRVVWEVEDEQWARGLRVLNQHFTAYVRQRGLLHEAVHGYVPGRSIRTNAEQHLEAQRIVKADIAEFFRSVTAGRVRAALADLGLDPEVARLVAHLSCIDGRLGLGLATAPTLANLVAAPIDDAFAELIAGSNVTYTRYADDLTFSGDSSLPTRDAIRAVLEEAGFLLAEDKFRDKKRGQAVVVTGLTVFEADGPRVPKRFKRRIRQEQHYIGLNGFVRHAGRAGYSTVQSCINRLDGRIQFVRGIERALGDALNRKWRALLAEHGRQVSWTSHPSDPAPAALFVDESVIESAGERLLVLGMVRARDSDAVRSLVSQTADELRRDWRRSGTGGAHLEDGVLHFVDLSEDARTVVAQMVENVPVRAFVSYGVLPTDTDYTTLWLELYEGLLRSRLMGLDGAEVSIAVEQNSRIRRADLENTTKRTYDELESQGARRPRHEPAVTVVSKEQDPGVALADAFLGLFGQYAQLLANPGLARAYRRGQRPTRETRFDRVRDKLRMVGSAKSGSRWSGREFEPWPDGVAT